VAPAALKKDAVDDVSSHSHDCLPHAPRSALKRASELTGSTAGAGYHMPAAVEQGLNIRSSSDQFEMMKTTGENVRGLLDAAAPSSLVHVLHASR
jgi:hypothetical protein